MTSFPRTLAVLLLLAATPGIAGAAAYDSVPASDALSFDVIRKGSDIGDQVISFDRTGDALTVHVKTDVKVKVPIIGVSAYVFKQTSTEKWQGGKLVSLTAKTNDNGKARDITLGASALVPANLWDADILSGGKLLNTIDGSTMQISARKIGTESVRAHGADVTATQYEITGGLNRDLWFDASRQLVHVRFPAEDGSQIDYVLR